ncbi:MAG TPA: SAM-dependent methyltransferase, partial [Candidatus Dormibacteraeota bacterium]
YYPPHPTWDRLHEIFLAGFRVDGADPLIGRRVPGIFEDAGLTEIQVEARMDVYPRGHSRRAIRLELLRTMRPKLVASGIVGETEFDDLDHSAQELLNDPRTLVLPILFFLVTGRRPE